MEIEAKFSLPDADTLAALARAESLAGFSLGPADVVKVRDEYVDTAAGHLRAGGLLLPHPAAERRRRAPHPEVDRARPARHPPARGVRDAAALGHRADRHRRRPLGRGRGEPGGAGSGPGWPDGDLRTKVLALAGDEPLLPLVELVQVRTVRLAADDGRAIVELSLDAVTVVVGGGNGHVSRGRGRIASRRHRGATCDDGGGIARRVGVGGRASGRSSSGRSRSSTPWAPRQPRSPRAPRPGRSRARAPTPIPKKLLAQGVRDMVRISDARMSGTSYGACVLHVAPESYIGGPLALVQRRRPDRARCRGAQARAESQRRRTRLAPRGVDSRPSRITRAASARCMKSTSRRRTKAATSISCTRARRRLTRRFTERRVLAIDAALSQFPQPLAGVVCLVRGAVDPAGDHRLAGLRHDRFEAACSEPSWAYARSRCSCARRSRASPRTATTAAPAAREPAGLGARPRCYSVSCWPPARPRSGICSCSSLVSARRRRAGPAGAAHHHFRSGAARGRDAGGGAQHDRVQHHAHRRPGGRGFPDRLGRRSG